MLADRVGIIDRGKLVAEGTPDELKAEIGRPTVEAVPADASELEPRWSRCSSASASRCPAPTAPPPCGSRDGAEELAEIVRALDAEDVEVADLQLHAPTLDDVFLAKTGRSLEGAERRGRRGRGARPRDR